MAKYKLKIIGIHAKTEAGDDVGIVNGWGALEILTNYSNGQFRASDLPNPNENISRAEVLGINEDSQLTIENVFYLGYSGLDKIEHTLSFQEYVENGRPEEIDSPY